MSATDTMTQLFPSGLPTLNLPTLDPTHFTALHSLDVDAIQTADGRDHQLDAHTPVHFSWVLDSVPDTSGVTPTPAASTALPTSSQHWWDSLLPDVPQHLGARVVVVIVGLLVLAVAVFKLAK